MKHSNNLLTMEKRNIVISLEKAREWYNKGGEYKELALSAFTKKEIIESALPNTWEEFCEMHPVEEDGEEYYIDVDSNTSYVYKGVRNPEFYKNVLPSKEAAEAHLAYMQLHQLRDCYRQGWVPNWSDDNIIKYCIALEENNRYIIYKNLISCKFLSFQSQEIAEKFLNNFKDLIEIAGDLI